MQFCKNCGHKLNPGQKFCPVCGTSPTKGISSESPPASDQTTGINQTPSHYHQQTSINQKPGTSETQSRTANKPIFQSKLSKVLTVAVLMVLVILFGTYKYIQSTMTPQKIQSKFADAVKTSNVAEMESVLDQNRPDVAINNDSVAGFINYFKKHPDEFTKVISNLTQDASKFADNPDYSNSNNPVSITKDGKKWMLFDNYAINLQPYYIDVTASRTATAVSINGKSVGEVSSQKKTFGPYLLSDFTVKGTYKGAYTTVSDTKSIDPSAQDGQHLTADLNVDGHSVSVYSSDNQAVLYVNGKSTGKKVADINTFGPVPIDGSVKMQAVGQGGTKSNIEPVTADGQEVDLEFADNTSSVVALAPMNSGTTTTVPSSNDAAQAVQTHYTEISNGDYSDAYNLMSAGMRAKYSLDSWSQGLKNNKENDVSISNVSVSSDNTTAVVTFNMTSYDNQADGKTLVQKWGGTWSLVVEDGQWKLDAPKITKLDSYTQ